MSPPPASLSREARRFLATHVQFVGRLEILVLLQSDSSTWWSAEAIASELRLPLDAAAAHLESLGAANVVGVRIAHDLLYRFDPGTEGIGQAVREIVAAYYTDRETVVARLGAGSARGARRFADAFRVRRRGRDG